jgi:hypothetical protein
MSHIPSLLASFTPGFISKLIYKQLKPRYWALTGLFHPHYNQLRRTNHLHSIYIEDLEKAAKQGLLNLDFENSYMFHTAFIHGHAHWPPISSPDHPAEERQFYGSVQPAVFDGPRVWSDEVRDLVEKCLVRIAPVMKAFAETAPGTECFEQK